MKYPASPKPNGLQSNGACMPVFAGGATSTRVLALIGRQASAAARPSATQAHFHACATANAVSGGTSNAEATMPAPVPP